MHVQFLKYSIAPPGPSPKRAPIGEHPAWKDRQHSVPHPSWTDIEAAIRRLDGRRYRSLIMWPIDNEQEQDCNPGEHEFLSLIGGDGLYYLTISFSDGRDCQFHFSEWPYQDVIVLPDPWGVIDGLWSEAACRVCRDVEVVVRAVQHYAETGALDPTITWETLT